MDAKTESEIAKVVTTIGQIKVQDREGNLRDVKPGDSLQEGDVVIAMPDARAELMSNEGQHYFLQPNESITLIPGMTGNEKADVYDLALTNITIEEILEAIDQEGTLDELLEATAAGLTGGVNGEGNSFVRLLRIVEEVSPELRLELDNAYSPEPVVFDDSVALDIEESAPPAQNLPPVAEPDIESTPEDIPVTIAVLGNDSDPDGDPLVVVAVDDQPIAVGDPVTIPEGVVSLNPDGTVTFTPSPDFNGPVEFPYTISDGVNTDTEVVSIEVTPVNDPPDAVADIGTTPEDTPITLVVLSNDTDIDGDTLTVTHVAGAPIIVGTPVLIPEGSVSLNGDGTLTFTPNPDFNGPVNFPYTITDGAASDTAQVSIDVTPVNDGPIAKADERTVDEDSAGITGNVITAPNAGEVADTDVDGDGLTVTNPGTYAGVYGDLVLNADGSYSYVPNANAQTLDDNETEQDVFSYTITDGDETSTTTLTINVTGSNDGPTVSNASGNVSEEGLAHGIKDTGGTVDTTDSAVTSGTIVINDVDGDAITSVVLMAPTDVLTSGGNTVTWSGQGTGTLVGMAGGKLVATLSIDTAGAYEFVLSAPLDHPDDTQEDALTLAFGVTASDGTDTGQGTLSLTVEDDAPTLIPKSHEINLVDNNVLIVLDVSGSMNNSDGIGGQTRLQTAIQSINTLLDGYDQFGDVAVRIVTFSSQANAIGTQWTDITEAKAQLASLSANGYTNYDAALDTAEIAFGSVGALTGGQNVSYFFSDGNPNRPSGSAGINGSEEANWEDFLEANQIASFAIGLGDNVNQDNLDPIAYNGQTMQEADAIVVNDYGDLDEVLIGTLPDMPMGSLLNGSLLSGVGADGGYVDFITVDGITYTYDPTGSGSVTVSGGPSSGVFNVLTQTLTIVTGIGGELEVNLATGMYNYSAPADAVSGQEELFAYGVIDNDGDTGESTLSIEVDSYNVINGTSSADHLVGTSANDLINAQGGNDVIQGAGGNDRLLGGAGNDTLFGNEGNDQLLGGLGNDLLAGGIGSDSFIWELGDRAAPGAPAVDEVTDFLAVDVLAGGDVLDLRDLLQGEDVGNLTDYLHFETDGADTVLQISSDGDFSSGYASALVDQTIVLHDIDLTSAGTMLDAQIINDLMQKGNLRVDI